MKKYLFLWLLACGSGWADDCQGLLEEVNSDESRLQELSKLSKELDAQFDEQVSADFDSQSEGIIDQVHHNAAVKLAFARKKMAKAIQEQESKSTNSREKICAATCDTSTLAVPCPPKK